MRKSKTRPKRSPKAHEPEQAGRYLELMNFRTPEDAYLRVKEMASDLSDNQHLIRSCIFDLHAAIELELRRIIFHTFKAQLFLTSDEKQNEKTIAALEKQWGGSVSWKCTGYFVRCLSHGPIQTSNQLDRSTTPEISRPTAMRLIGFCTRAEIPSQRRTALRKCISTSGRCAKRLPSSSTEQSSDQCAF